MAQFEIVQSAESAVPVKCWSCAVAQNESTLFCSTCSKIQPPLRMDYFQVFQLPRKLRIDLAALEKEFHRLSRKLHPDRFARATESEREWSLADTALVNDAYRTLRDPIRRTEYLLKLAGEEIGEEHAGHGNGRRGSRVPDELLEEVFELNMQLDELRQGDSTQRGEVEAAKERFEQMIAETGRELEEQWARWDEGNEAEKSAAQKRMVALLDRRRYLDNLLRDVKQVLGA
jgi:molecular chaperone HscB